MFESTELNKGSACLACTGFRSLEAIIHTFLVENRHFSSSCNNNLFYYKFHYTEVTEWKLHG